MDIIVISTVTFQVLSLIALIMMVLSIRDKDKDGRSGTHKTLYYDDSIAEPYDSPIGKKQNAGRWLQRTRIIRAVNPSMKRHKTPVNTGSDDGTENPSQQTE